MHEPRRGFWLLLGCLYTTQFLALGFFVVALVAILRGEGASLDTIGLVYLLGTFGALKFLWAPLIDRFALRRVGHYRGWLLGLQSAMVVVLLAMGRFEPMADFPLVYALCMLVALCSMMQDVAVDALACRMVPPSQRGLANGLQTAGGLLSFMIGGGLVLMAYPHVGWRGAMWILAAGNAVSLLPLLFFREPRWPARQQRGRDLLLRVWTFWRQPGGGHWLLMLALCPTAIGLSYIMITPVLVDAGWPMARIGLVVNILGSLVGAVSAVLTGWVIRHVGRRRVLIGAALLQIPAVLAVAIPVAGHTGVVAVALAVSLYYIAYNPTWTVLATMMMDRAAPSSPGTDYSLQWSFYVAFQMAISAAGMALAERFGYQGVLLLATAVACVTVLAAWRYRVPGADGTQQAANAGGAAEAPGARC